MKVIDYVVVQVNPEFMSKLQEKVQDLLKKGYQPYGLPMIVQDLYHQLEPLVKSSPSVSYTLHISQVMVKYEEEK